MKRLLSVALAFMVTLGMCASPANAATKYPTKPITVLCVYGPGGAADLGLRIVAEYATKHGFTMNVVNKPGGSGTQASQDVLKSRPDGHMVLFGSTGLITLSLMKKLGYTIDDFTPVADISDMPLTFCVSSKSGVKTFAEWMDKARENPGEYSYGSPGAITSQRLFFSLLLKEKFQGVQVNHVPYNSGHEVNTALLSDQVKCAFGVPGTNRNYLQSGDFTLLAVTSPKRLAEYPDVPTFAELYGDQHSWVSFHGMFVNKKTPKEIVEKLSGIVGEALKDPEVQEKFQKIGITCDYKDSREFAAYIQNTQNRIKAALKLIGM